jgi:hypothetical protein
VVKLVAVKLVSIATFLLLLSACSTEAETKPGPNGSWWLGGADGGVFVLIQPDSKEYKGTVYYEHDQSIWYQGRFRLVGALDFNPQDHSQYLGWDGERILLIESAYLQALDPMLAP